MLPSPWSIGFVIATILGAMLVPGCRPNMVSQEAHVLQTQLGSGATGDGGGQARDPTWRTSASRLSWSAAALSPASPPAGSLMYQAPGSAEPSTVPPTLSAAAARSAAPASGAKTTTSKSWAMVAEPLGPPHAAPRMLSTGAGGPAESRVAAGRVSEGDRVVSAPPAATAVSEPDRETVCRVSRATATLSPGAARPSPGVARVSEGALAVVSEAVWLTAAGGAISNGATETESAMAMWCQTENIEA